ncbi:GFA family protein [Pseudomonas sp. UL073]|uniref:GFA family protein n=1 Tax=Zestomonas insulae TaxID=2809017 RepID=A0ABS2IIP0_9GAMM|nr:GFA family protein [Pseudomonas insulae]MBM7062548.1 GFA family protein [Pseudomonas insulae]
MSDLHLGGCHCGSLRYQFSAPLRDIAHCHCSVCRRVSGGLITTWLSVPLETFIWSAGEPAQYRSSASCTRYFCPTCGAQLALFTNLSPHSLDVTVATLDQPERALPDRHIWVSSRLPWLHLDPQLPEEDEERL